MNFIWITSINDPFGFRLKDRLAQSVLEIAAASTEMASALTTPIKYTAEGPFLKVYLYRGFIGLPKSIKDNAKCLGLTKRYQTVYVPPHPSCIGNILKIKELVKVELVDKKPAPRVGPMYPKGYAVQGNYLHPH